MCKLGIIDSGIGGINVLKALIERGVGSDYYYISDDLNLPYGEKSKTELGAITFRNIEKLIKCGVDIVVIACNTATGACINDMRRTFTLPIVGTEPPLKRALEQGKSIAIMATPFTLRCESVSNFISEYTERDYYFPNCKNLAAFIEKNYNNQTALYYYILDILAGYTKCDSVVLGCTHYNFAIPQIKKCLPCSKIFEPCDGVARRVAKLYGGGSLKTPHIYYYSSGYFLDEKKIAFLSEYLNLGIEIVGKM